MENAIAGTPQQGSIVTFGTASLHRAFPGLQLCNRLLHAHGEYDEQFTNLSTRRGD